MKVSKVGKILILVAVLSPLLTGIAEARKEGPGDINSYRLQLKDRIELGQKWGKLTPAETDLLQEDLRILSRLERRSSRDGLTERERRSIWKELEKIDKSITAELNDRERTGWHKNWDRKHDGMAHWQTHHKKFDYNEFDDALNKLTKKTQAGITAGQINRDESAYLKEEESRLRAVLNNAKAGGMTADEVSNFEHMVAKYDERLQRALQPVPSRQWNSGNWHHGWKNSKHPTVRNLTTPPQWSVNKEGGYEDITGQVSGTVPGNELYKYGGTMKRDGRAVPTTPHVHIDTSGHIAW